MNKKGPITGTFIDEITYDIPSSNWSREQWIQDLDNMQEIGIDTLIFIRGGFEGKTIFPSKVIGTEWTDDFAGLIFDEAARRKMDVFFGLYTSNLDWNGGDAAGYDIDQCNEDNIYQFNYSHHNTGGFMLACTGCNCKDSVRDCIVRNNLSVNDGLERDIPIFTISGPMRNIKYINNTVYTDNEQLYQLFRVTDYMRLGLPQDLLFANNLFVSKHTNNRNAFEMSGPITFDSNIFVNMPALPDRENVIVKNNYVGLNPALSAEYYEPGDRLDTDGFVPLWDSPLLRLGKHFPECADTDYRGLDAKNHNYIGAFYYKDANIG